MRGFQKNQNGFTLLEVLLSIVLLGIILTSFAGLFAQSAEFTKRNDQKLTAVQISQKVVNIIEENVTKQSLIDDNIVDSAGKVIGGSRILSQAEIEDDISQTLNPGFIVSAVITNSSAENLIQYKIIVQEKTNLKNQSETFTYIRR
ncbi:prepilin-type N-terminal cleavage/methylation domain-containing protein [Neobacillus sp. PS3-34]|uniref:type IV pilus modification PilV family protein n=1 Tax=Neobacillus sp. PS3-34 TaxID=3070678 RepID=UPI0027E1A5E6|nr:prepilin-type N-terminal cleavage/methylation domain-containing protein [Neobacillus sp. PS3-34]WML47371.1 prepilin-type N-terminal cleavage/methylation domain-containing protein [Neobacillus sp. PS3-34]